jgi:putative PEP-CTERM system TPR-repeat lipoprotein
MMKLPVLSVLVAVCALGAQPVFAADTASAYYEKARQYSQQAQWREAELELRNSLQQNPAYLPARLMLGQVLLKAGNWSSAEKELQLALDGGAAVEPLIYDLLRALLAQQKTAETAFLLEQHPTLKVRPAYQLMQANLLKLQYKYDEAATLYQQALAQADHDLADEIRFQFAELRLNQQQFSQIPPLLQSIRSEGNFATKAQYLQAQLHLVQQQPDLALRIYQQLLSKDQNDPIALLGKARVLQQQGKLAEALQSIVLYREKFPYNPYGQLIHAALIGLQGDDKEQNRMLRQVQMQLNNLPEDAKEQEDVLLLAATMDFSQEKFEQAILKLRRALKLYPANYQVHQLLAQSYLQLNDAKTAAGFSQQAIKLNPADFQLYLLAAAIARAQQDAAAEMTVLQTAFQAFPQQSEVRKAYIQSLLRNQQSAKARQLLSEQPGNNQQADLIVLGYLQLEQGLLGDARQTTADLLKADQSKVEIFQLAGDVSAKSGDAALARQFYQQALTLDEAYKPSLLSMASLALQQQDWSGAMQSYQILLQKDATDPLVLQLMADAALRLGKATEAIHFLQQLDPQDVKLVPARMALMELYLQTNALAEAKALAEQLTEQTDISADLYFAKARLALKQQNQAEALRLNDILYGLWYDQPWRLRDLADLQLSAKDSNGARKTLNRLQALDSDEIQLSLLQARLALLEQRYADGLRQLQKLESLQANQPAVAELKAHFYLAQGQNKAALEVLTPLFRQSGAQQHLLLLLQAQRDQPAVVQQLLQDWLQQHPTDLSATLALAEQLEQTGAPEQARAVYQQSPLLATQAILQNNLAVLLFDTDPQQALQWAEKAHLSMPEQADILDTYGYALVKAGQAEKGLGVLREAEIRQPQATLLQLHIAAALLQLQRTAEAKAILSALSGRELTTSEQQLLQQLLKY